MSDLDQWGKVQGLARLDPGMLVLEFRTHLLGLIRTGIREVQIPLTEVAEIRVDYRVFYSLIRLRTRSLKTIAQIPGLKGASLKLRIEGLDSHRVARSFVAEVDYQRVMALHGSDPPSTALSEPDPIS